MWADPSITNNILNQLNEQNNAILSQSHCKELQITE
jgi:hypothetical protein